MIWSFLRSEGHWRNSGLRDQAILIRDKLSEWGDDGGIPGRSLLSFVLEHCSGHKYRTIDIGHALFVARILVLIRQNSSVPIDRSIRKIDGLISRIERGLRFEVRAELARVSDFERRHDEWLESTRPLLDALLPLFPTHEEIDGEPDFVGQSYSSTMTLLLRASDPHLKIYEVCRALLNINGSGFTREMMPDYGSLMNGQGSPLTLLDKHLGTTLLASALSATLETKVRVPLPIRFEHTHVLGGTGHGKTQFLQSLILQDLEAALEGRGSLVVIDGQGDLINRITRLKYFDPDNPSGLSEKLVLIDANDIEFPVAINMFSLNEEQLHSYSAADRERLFNATIGLYEYFFGALLGADLTQRQGLIFKYLARLMFVIPDATIHTLLDVMENGQAYQPYIDRLDTTSRRFFDQQFFDKAFDDTKQQIATRLWGVISNTSLDRMFSSTETRFDFFDAINSGKIVLINTAKDLLQVDGNAIMGRFFIALLARAILQRQVIPEDRRRATFAYIDEVQDYIQNDNRIEDILNQARKYKVGLLCAHQNLEQLSREQRATFFASTSIKFVGGVSAKDARALAGDMRTDEEFLLKARKEVGRTNFACFVKNITPQAIMVPIEFGQMEKIDRLSDRQYERLLANNRAKYCSKSAPEPTNLEDGCSEEEREDSDDGEFQLGKPELL